MESATVITCHPRYLIERCLERGFEITEVMPCVIKRNGTEWTIDTTHPAYPSADKAVNKLQYSSSAAKSCRAGTELKKLIKKWLNIDVTEKCKCTARAHLMDLNGCDWCLQNIGLITGWLREEAEKRQLPFIELAAKILIKRAITNARKIVQQ